MYLSWCLELLGFVERNTATRHDGVYQWKGQRNLDANAAYNVLLENTVKMVESTLWRLKQASPQCCDLDVMLL